MPAYKGRILSGGRVQIPADVRKELGLTDGASVRFEVVDGELRVRSREAVISAIQAEVRQYVPAGVNLSDEIILDRRAESLR